MATPFNVKKLIFSLITLLCVVIAVLYTLFSARSRGPEHSNLSSPPAGQSSSATAGKSPSDAGTQSLNDVPRQTHQKTPSDLSTGGTASATASKVGSPSGTQAEARQEGKLHAVPRLVAINLRDSPDLGKVEFAPLDAVDEQKTPTDLHCERVYFAANKGICLSRQIKMLSAQTVATLVDANFQPITTFRTDGIPTRARISPDGRFAAFTVFVTGHSYTDVQMSTATLLLNIEEGKIIANLRFQLLGRHLSTRQQLFLCDVAHGRNGLSRPRGYQSKDGDCDLPKRRLPLAVTRRDAHRLQEDAFAQQLAFECS